MAVKKVAAAAKKAASKQDHGTPVFPYTNEPKALKRLLAAIPNKPKPTKMTMDTLKSWSVSSSNNAGSVIRVLKKIGLLQESGEPNDSYVEFMKTGVGPTTLGQLIRKAYKPLFDNSLAPQTESNDELKKLFHIHTGGAEDAMRYQMQTFKSLAEYASFDASNRSTPTDSGNGNTSSEPGKPSNNTPRVPPVQIDLHIHLPENKSVRDYEAIIQDIAKYIYGRDIERT